MRGKNRSLEKILTSEERRKTLSAKKILKNIAPVGVFKSEGRKNNTGFSEIPLGRTEIISSRKMLSME